MKWVSLREEEESLRVSLTNKRMDSSFRTDSTDIEANSSAKPKGEPMGRWDCSCHHYLPSPSLIRKVIAETIATFFLVFVTCGSAGMSASDGGRESKLGASVAGGLIVTVMIYAVGHVSGAHMNPAVTLAFAAVRHFPWKQVPFYVAAQMTGAVGASFMLRAVIGPTASSLGTTTPSGPPLQAFAMEVAVTYAMMFVASAVATDDKAIQSLGGLAVGSAVTIASIFAGPISGGSMNPARSIGPAISSGRYESLWVYITGPLLGTLMGGWSYHIIRDHPHHQ